MGSRWYEGGDRGLYLGGSLAAFRDCERFDVAEYPNFVRSLTYTATIGWRFRIGPLYLDAGLGPAVTREHNQGPYSGLAPGPGSPYENTHWKIGGSGGYEFPSYIDLGLGLAF